MPPYNGITWAWFIFSTIFLAIAINILSDYLKPFLDRRLERVSASRRIRNQLENEEFERQLTLLRNSHTMISILDGRVTRGRINSVTYLLVLIVAGFQYSTQDRALVELVQEYFRVRTTENLENMVMSLVVYLLFVVGLFGFLNFSKRYRADRRLLNAYWEILSDDSNLPPN